MHRWTVIAVNGDDRLASEYNHAILCQMVTECMQHGLMIEGMVECFEEENPVIFLAGWGVTELTSHGLDTKSQRFSLRVDEIQVPLLDVHDCDIASHPGEVQADLPIAWPVFQNTIARFYIQRLQYCPEGLQHITDKAAAGCAIKIWNIVGCQPIPIVVEIIGKFISLRIVSVPARDLRQKNLDLLAIGSRKGIQFEFRPSIFRKRPDKIRHCFDAGGLGPMARIDLG
ncbi:hypothetical protein RGI145_05205 [Roseomonas gilardii]|uniref:Uncharacterized protein n=1 Tax=Roseomonas gilardii TaxID=257708 RepID=A0A1L7ACW8_9PROT|nr:hypothetical protein RGI145_05205 [Roseomonas gilardii]